MTQKLLDDFTASADTLRVYADGRLIFSSVKDRLLPMLEYLETVAPRYKDVVIIDRIMGNAAALLAVLANCREAYSPLGSELAVRTLDTHGIPHHLNQLVPYILKPDGSEMCPMERLSLDKSPDAFYRTLKSKILPGK